MATQESKTCQIMMFPFSCRWFLAAGFWLLVSLNFSFAQSNKKIKKNEVKTQTEWQYSYNEGKESGYKSAYFKYDKNGNILEETTYNADGTINKKATYKYNGNGDVVEIIRYNPDGSVKRKTIYQYDKNNLWTIRTDYDGDGKVIKREKRIFEYY